MLHVQCLELSLAHTKRYKRDNKITQTAGPQALHVGNLVLIPGTEVSLHTKSGVPSKYYRVCH